MLYPEKKPMVIHLPWNVSSCWGSGNNLRGNCVMVVQEIVFLYFLPGYCRELILKWCWPASGHGDNICETCLASAFLHVVQPLPELELLLTAWENQSWPLSACFASLGTAALWGIGTIFVLGSVVQISLSSDEVWSNTSQVQKRNTPFHLSGNWTNPIAVPPVQWDFWLSRYEANRAAEYKFTNFKPKFSLVDCEGVF